MQIRDVPDDVHEALSAAAAAAGLSLTAYVRRELAAVALRSAVAADNVAVVRATQKRVRRRARREAILAVLHEGRG
jgi:plasmid stability protein